MIITIDGRECSCERGEYLLQIAKRNGINIPSLCYHEGLGALGACRVCIVEVISKGKSTVVSSCIYPVESEIEVLTASETIKEQRGIIFALLARLAPDAKIIQQMASFAGVDIPRFSDKEGGSTCILCGRCTTACDLVGAGAIAKVNRGTTKDISTPYGQPSLECIGCAGCAHVCPTDSIAYTESETTVSIWERTFDLQRCACCGKPISTDELIAVTAQKDSADEPALCLECRKLAVADKLCQGFKL